MSTVYHLRATVAAIKPSRTTASGTVRRDLVLSDPVGRTGRLQPILVGFTGDRTTLLDDLEIGDYVEIDFGISGHIDPRPPVPRHIVSLYGLGVIKLPAPPVIQ